MESGNSAVYRRVLIWRVGSTAYILLLQSDRQGFGLRILTPPRSGHRLEADNFMHIWNRPARFLTAMHRPERRPFVLAEAIGHIKAELNAGRVASFTQVPAPTGGISTDDLVIRMGVYPDVAAPEHLVADDLAHLVGWSEPTEQQLAWF